MARHWALMFLEFFERAYKIRATTFFPRLGRLIIDRPSLNLIWGQSNRLGYQADDTNPYVRRWSDYGASV